MMGYLWVALKPFSSRKKRMKINKIPVLNSLYFSVEFLIKRILPKVSFTKKYYFDITKGNDRLLSKAEGLGRLVSCGFKIMDFNSIDGMLYFVVKKVAEPKFDLSPSYGPVYKMNRLGKTEKFLAFISLEPCTLTASIYKIISSRPMVIPKQENLPMTLGFLPGVNL